MFLTIFLVPLNVNIFFVYMFYKHVFFLHSAYSLKTVNFQNITPS